MTVVTRGEREIALRFETFPARAHDRLQARITALTERLESRSEAAAPYRTGTLRSEITGRVYSGDERIAGYVSVFSPRDPREYAKAATLEYGSHKGRKIFARSGRDRRRIVQRLSKPARIKAFRFLRGPLDEMRPEIEAELDAALAQTAEEENL